MHVVLYQPEIPANTGNIARLCAVTDCHLHLIRPLGFFLDDRRMRRAGLDYWHQLRITIHDSWEDFAGRDLSQAFFVETGSSRRYTDADFGPNPILVLGSETAGLPDSVLSAYPDRHISLPMIGTRSLNLANTAAIVVYEVWRQQGFPGAETERRMV